MTFGEFIYQLPIVRSVIRFSKRFRPPGFEGVTLYEVTSFFIRQIEQGRLNQRAAAISFNFIMALPPACIFLFSLVPLFPIADQFYNEVNSFVRDLTPNAATRDIVESFLDDFFKRPKNSLLSIGFLTSLYFSSNAVLGIIHSSRSGKQKLFGLPVESDSVDLCNYFTFCSQHYFVNHARHFV